MPEFLEFSVEQNNFPVRISTSYFNVYCCGYKTNPVCIENTNEKGLIHFRPLVPDDVTNPRSSAHRDLPESGGRTCIPQRSVMTYTAGAARGF